MLSAVLVLIYDSVTLLAQLLSHTATAVINEVTCVGSLLIVILL